MCLLTASHRTGSVQAAQGNRILIGAVPAMGRIGGSTSSGYTVRKDLKLHRRFQGRLVRAWNLAVTPDKEVLRSAGYDLIVYRCVLGTPSNGPCHQRAA